jgi:hypothetical protein
MKVATFFFAPSAFSLGLCVNLTRQDQFHAKAQRQNEGAKKIRLNGTFLAE